MVYLIITSSEFDDWYGRQNTKEKLQIDERLSKIQLTGYFGEQNYQASPSE